MSKIAVILLLALSFFPTCRDNVRFECPQPDGVRNLNRFPLKVCGQYLNSTDSSMLFITDKMMYAVYSAGFRAAILDIDTSKDMRLVNDSLYLSDLNLSLKVNRQGDSVSGYHMFKDTLFLFSDRHVLRKCNGHFLLNHKQQDSLWSVQVLSLKNGRLSVKAINSSHDIERIRQITNVESVTDSSGAVVNYKLSPSRRDLRKMIAGYMFTKGDDFLKVKSSK